MRHISGFTNSGRKIVPCIAGIRTQIFYLSLHNRLSDFALQHCGKLSRIMPIGSGYDDRQRDATLIDQQMSFYSFFSPYPSGLRRNF